MSDEQNQQPNGLTRVTFAMEARRSLFKGLSIAAEAVGCTLGPRGKTVLIQRANGSPIVTKDGVSVAKSIRLKDPLARMGAQLVQEAASQTNDLAGDGTTTSTVLTHAMVEEGLKYLEAGMPAVKLTEGINMAVTAIIAELKSSALQVDGHETLKNIAAISANNDQFIGELIANAMERVGREGIITVEDAKGTTTSLEVIEGLQFERGYLSPYFVTNSDRMHAAYNDCRVLITDKKISALKDILPILEAAHQQKVPLLIIAEDVEGEALQTLAVNVVKSGLKIVAVKAPGYGNHKKELLNDMCILTGATLVSADTGISLEKATLAMTGLCKKVVVDGKSTMMVGTGATKDAVSARTDDLRSQIQDVTLTPDEMTKLRVRIARLAAGVAIIRVGGATELEMIERKYRIEDSLHATRAAIEEGVVPGGGSALVLASTKAPTSPDRDIQAGINIVVKACQAPLRKIVTNANGQPDVVIRDLIEIHKTIADGHLWGFNALSGEHVNMLDAGVIDPCKVSRLALLHAASVASTFMSLDAVVSEENV
jgi:chaperonin GroEL